MDIAELGFTVEELQDRVVSQCVERLLTKVAYDEDGDPYNAGSSIYNKLRKEMFDRVDSAIAKIADDHFEPLLKQKIESLTMQRTNEWGEPQGKEVSFIEYLVERAEKYFEEEVDSQGRTKAECRRRGSSFYSSGNRATVLIDRHMDIAIKMAMEKAVVGANKQLSDALAKTAKEKLAEISERLEVSVST